MLSELPPLRKGRLGSRKSANGCITCKIRKVKCDEQRPFCRRCCSTGRRCDGYQSNLVTPGAAIPVGSDSICQISSYGYVEQVEVRCFEFFIERIVPGFTRIVDDQFWHKTVPQLSRTEPVLWNAVIAMSCLIQYPQYSAAPAPPGSSKGPITNEHHRKALTWYGKSMSTLNDRISQEKTRSPLVLISCIIYCCIECLQDNIVDAVALYQRAVGMVGLVDQENRRHSSTTQDESLVEVAVRAILRHESTSHGLPVPRTNVSLDSTTGHFGALSDAREELYALLSECQVFLQHIRAIQGSQGKDWSPSSGYIQQQEYLQMNLLRWHSAFANMSATSGTAHTNPDEEELRSVLLTAYGQYFIWLSVCLSTFETSYDNFFPQFQSIVDYASRAIAATKPEHRPVFVLESRVIPSLYFVAIKCRHPHIRREALSLLRSGPQVENIWKAEPMANVAERSIGVEESGSEDGIFYAQPLSSETPPEQNRLYQQEVAELKDTAGQPIYYLIIKRWQQDDDLKWFRAEHRVKFWPPVP